MRRSNGERFALEDARLRLGPAGGRARVGGRRREGRVLATGRVADGRNGRGSSRAVDVPRLVPLGCAATQRGDMQRHPIRGRRTA
jgi:hypothetical protein